MGVRAVADWTRAAWRNGDEVEMHALQFDVAESDLDLFQRYWRAQFGGLNSETGKKSRRSKHSGVGLKVIEAIRAK